MSKGKKYISIDIGSKNMKVICGKFNGKKILIDSYDIIVTPTNSIHDGKLINVKEIVESIKNIIIKKKMKASEIILCATGSGVITRDINVPKSTDIELKSIIDFEAQQYFPVDLSNYILDYKVIEEVKKVDGTFYNVLLVAFPLKQAEDYMKIPEMLNMRVAAIDLPANCIYKFLFGPEILSETEANDSETPSEFAVLDIGAETTGISIFCNGKLKFNRILLNGSNEIDKRISNEEGIDFKEAENSKLFLAKIDSEAEKWENSEDVLRISNIAKESILNLIEEINRFFEFYNSRNSNNNIKKIYICGGGSNLQGLPNFFYNSFGIPTEFINSSFFNIDLIGNFDKDDFNKDFIFLINSIGALVRV